jgi:alpha-D-xyloside xylohydrolase
LDHPDDPQVSTVDDQYLMGDRIMVAPLFAGESQRKVVFPSGTDWHDFWTGEVVRGGSTITVGRSTPDIPVYVKAGSIMPWADVGPHTGTPESRKVTARVYGDGSLNFTLPGEPGALLRWSGNAGALSGATEYVVKQWKVIG